MAKASATLAGMKEKKNDMEMDESEVVILKEFNDDQKNAHAQGGDRGNDSEEEEDDDPRTRGGAG